MEKERREESAARSVAQSEVWYFFCRDVSLPYYRMAATHFASRGDIAKAVDVFETMGLDLSKLSQIRIRDEDGWVALAQLANREIRLILGETGGPLIRIYTPSGEVIKVEWYHRFLNLVPAEDVTNVRWYHRWLNKILDLFPKDSWASSVRNRKRVKI